MSAFIVASPAHRCDAGLAVAAVRAGAVGLLDLGYHESGEPRRAALAELVRDTKDRAGLWGCRWDLLGDAKRSPAVLQPLAAGRRWPVLLLAGLGDDPAALAAMLTEARQLADKVWLEIYSLPHALAAQQAGYDGVIARGHEAGGRGAVESSFLLLQQLHGKLSIPYWIQGGVGLDTAAAALVSGAAGVVLAEQTWLLAESPFDRTERKAWSQLDGSETVVVGDQGLPFRVFSRADRKNVADFDRQLAAGCNWPAVLAARLCHPGSEDPLVPLSQDIGLAARLASQFTNVADLLRGLRQRIEQNFAQAPAQAALKAGGPLAKTLGTQFPVLQGPMTRVSDTAAFCDAVATNGGLPFLALALMPGPEVKTLLTEAHARLGDKPWGVGILGFVPAELRKAQLDVICDIKPKFAIIAGGRPSQATQLEKLNISTFLHVPSPGLLEIFIKDGARKFIFEGRECGGHVGPRSSFCLWQAAIDVLLKTELKNPAELQIVFAGGIHDSLSAAMVATLAAPLVARGIQVGVLMGTGYLFTNEAVTCGAITEEFQRQAILCQETVLLESGVGHATRCVPTPFAEEFLAAKNELLLSGKTSDEIRFELEILNIGRLRIASKGLVRQSDPRDPNKKAEIVQVDAETQRQTGMYMIGQLAALRDRALPMSEFHSAATEGAAALLADLVRRPLPWHVAAQQARAAAEPIAIVGMSCLFPKAGELRTYWENILRQLNAITEVPRDRWREEDFFDEDRLARDKVYSKWGGFLDPIRFDPMQWKIPPASLKSIDPIQLIALEVAWKAFQDAGYEKRKLPRDRMGVIFAVAGSHDVGTEYCYRTMSQHFLPQVAGLSDETRQAILDDLAQRLPEWTEDSFPGFLMNVVAGRVANRLDLGGPNFVVDAACAASLAALNAGIDQLRTRSADAVIVGAADGQNNAFCYMSFAKTHALSPRGRSRPFDDSADGIALGEGVAAVVIKRLSDAERDGDKIYAVIRGIGNSSDGRNRSMTAPHPPGQILAIERAYADAGLEPSTVTLVEAHGTGTAVGDSSEITSLSQVFAKAAAAPQSTAVGSVKSMIGHTKTCAGLASLIKTTLALHHGILPPTIGVETPNSKADFAQGPFYINTEARPWFRTSPDAPRRAGVSAFGFGGTNFHVVLEEYAAGRRSAPEGDVSPRQAEVFVWRRNSRAEIVAQLKLLQTKLADSPLSDLAALGTAVWFEESQRGTRAGKARLGLVASDVADLKTKLDKAVAKLAEEAPQWQDPSGVYYAETAAIDPSQVCFLYPGQGSQQLDMLRDLVLVNRWSRDHFEHAESLLHKRVGSSLLRAIYPPPTFEAAARTRQQAELNDTRVAQPALGVVELFATELLARYGLTPGVAAGHSYGEYVALAAAGVLKPDDLLRLSAERGRIAADACTTTPGGMAAVVADAEKTEAALKELGLSLKLANLNAPDQTIIGGPVDEIERAVELLTKKGLRTKRIPVSAPFHTPFLQPAAKQLAAYLGGVELRKPRIPVYSNTTATRHSSDDTAIADLLARHIVEPVQFDREVRTIHADGATVFIEVGPGRVLTGLVGRILKDRTHVALALDAPGRDGVTQFAHLLAQAAALGLPVKIDDWYAARGHAEVSSAECLQKALDTHKPGRAEWMLSPARAVPVTPLPPARLPGEGLRAKFGGQPAPAAAPAPQPTPAPAAVAAPVAPPAPKTPTPLRVTPPAPAAASRPASEPRSAVTRTVPPTPVSQPAPAPTPTPARIQPVTPVTSLHVPERLPAPMHPASSHGEISHGTTSPVDLMSQYQLMMTRWLELQQMQQQVSARFLDTQERVLMSYLQGAPVLSSTALTMLAPPAPLPAMPAPAPVIHQAPVAAAPAPAPAAPAVAAPRIAVTPAPAVVRPPVAVATAPPSAVVKSAPAPVAATNGHHANGTNGAAKPAPRPVVEAAPAPAPAPVAVAPVAAVAAPAGVPSTEMFKTDLLAAVSERTGYPTDMLDIDLPMESGLGIDSIKTVEIFSNLKTYHSVFRQEGQDEEELLVEFTKLKTLRDIVDGYDRRVQALSAPAAAAATNGHKAVAHERNGEEPSAPVQRFTVEAVEAPFVGAGEKKNSPSRT